ncbi:metal activated pyridoxal enzyme [Idiomarina sp. WRN-38]|uniref:DSD1 family PLP-dependent enzyme n=1 Tax=Idiomarina sp. OXR-189 TaxID=3100175 RepID=UPI0007333B85|nr:DSD1 family PLP-dependent enzyme [Idiomarina sp. OXR-189]KTG23271.1 metal activated pyridoxal enzyme [Idiomarina sp. H105]OAE90664.1 metal activated pyridoxal enzyme [Idiomarina sp. WRN-38]WPZ00581.1 DSD1 family PLP-dependent enzyme [Idiomarina sp. OXR-189]|tara:strand:+ start:12 stop:1136 length:1125 start_codon:yes stop_codon:yes gene_type:complete
MTVPQWIDTLDTPYLLIDEAILKRNIAHLKNRVESLGSHLRPHLKTLRTLEAADYLLADKTRPATVSTLAEAEAYANAGYTDLLYAVGIAPAKLERVAQLRKHGINLHILLDNMVQAKAVSDFARKHQQDFSVFIEIDSDDHRGGIKPEAPELIDIAQQLGRHFTGLMTHAGGSYGCNTADALKAFAKRECDAVLSAKSRLEASNIHCSITSVGSTPTAHYGEDFSEITEVRAGVYTTFDLVMKNIGVCDFSDIAMSVVTTVIGYNKEKGWVLTDSGWMALSRDRGTASQSQDFGYGQVCKTDGSVLTGLCVNSTSQEHGVIELNDAYQLEDFPVGSQLRILPNHACATAAMHPLYHILMSDGSHNTWQRIMGW